MFSDFSRLRYLRVCFQFLLIHYLMIAVCFIKGSQVVVLVLHWVSVISMVLSFVSSIRSAISSSTDFVSVRVISIICSILFSWFSESLIFSCLSYLIFCNYNSARTFSFVNFCIISFSFGVSSLLQFGKNFPMLWMLKVIYMLMKII